MHCVINSTLLITIMLVMEPRQIMSLKNTDKFLQYKGQKLRWLYAIGSEVFSCIYINFFATNRYSKLNYRQRQSIECITHVRRNLKQVVKSESLYSVLVRPHNTKMCGKNFNFGAMLFLTHEYMHYSCGIVDKTLKVWDPKDANEIKCVIKNLPSEYQKLGRLGIHAFRSTCRKQFMLCDLEFPRILKPSEELPFAPFNDSIKTTRYGGTCGMLNFKFKNNTVTELQLAEMSCESEVPIICEGH